MLINLTPNLEEISRRKLIAQENNFEYVPQSDPKWLQETGIYQSSFGHNFQEYEFLEKLDAYNYNDALYERRPILDEFFQENYVALYGVADNIEQIKEFYKKQIDDLNTQWVIALTPVWQDKKNKGKGGGWRWHEWGEYIGKLDSQYEYLDDEEFGEDFEYVICFHLYKVLNIIT